MHLYIHYFLCGYDQYRISLRKSSFCLDHGSISPPSLPRFYRLPPTQLLMVLKCIVFHGQEQCCSRKIDHFPGALYSLMDQDSEHLCQNQKLLSPLKPCLTSPLPLVRPQSSNFLNFLKQQHQLVAKCSTREHT